MCAQLPLLHRRLATAQDLDRPVYAAQACSGLCVPPGSRDCVLSCLCCAAAGMLEQPCHPRCAQLPVLHCCLKALAALRAQHTIAPAVSLHWPAAAPGVLCMLGLPSWGGSLCTAAKFDLLHSQATCLDSKIPEGGWCFLSSPQVPPAWLLTAPLLVSCPPLQCSNIRVQHMQLLFRVAATHSSSEKVNSQAPSCIRFFAADGSTPRCSAPTASASS